MSAGDGEEPLQRAEDLLRARDIEPALKLFQVAGTNAADADRCSAGRWMSHMLAGDFAAAWRESDALRKRDAPDPHRLWMGQAIDQKRLMLRCLHGFGDAVQMLRYAPQLRARAANLTVEVDPALVELAQCFEGVDEVITWGEFAPASPPQWDVQMELMELPYFFRTQPWELPVVTNYLHLPPAEDLDMGGPYPERLRVGVVWASGSWNPSRSVPFALMQTVFDAPGCKFWNLQGGPEGMQAAAPCSTANLHTDLRCGSSVMRLAQIIARLDVVITPDTLAAHLAGALGTLAWVMLEHAADWRWMLGRDDSPWYPTLRLFRQTRQGDWSVVLESIRRELAVAHARLKESHG